MKRMACVTALAALAGCQVSSPVATGPVMVDRPVPVACLAERPERPAYRFGKGDKPTEIEQAGILIEDFEKAEQYGIAWEAAAAACRVSPPGN